MVSLQRAFAYPKVSSQVVASETSAAYWEAIQRYASVIIDIQLRRSDMLVEKESANELRLRRSRTRTITK